VHLPLPRRVEQRKGITTDACKGNSSTHVAFACTSRRQQLPVCVACSADCCGLCELMHLTVRAAMH
jgi:hypothetical protein